MYAKCWTVSNLGKCVVIHQINQFNCFCISNCLLYCASVFCLAAFLFAAFLIICRCRVAGSTLTFICPSFTKQACCVMRFLIVVYLVLWLNYWRRRMQTMNNYLQLSRVYITDDGMGAMQLNNIQTVARDSQLLSLVICIRVKWFHH